MHGTNTDKKRRLSRSMRVFLLMFACLLSVSCACVAFLGDRMVNTQRVAYHARIERETEQVFSYVGQCFKNNVVSCNTIFFSNWYEHYRNVANIYADEFNALKRIEISESLQSMVTGMQFVSDVLVITPAFDTVICSSGWYTIDNYLTIYKTVDIDVSAGSTVNPSVTPRAGYCVIALNDPTQRRDKSLVCLVIEKKAVASCLQSMCPEYCTFMEAILEDQTLVRFGTPSSLLTRILTYPSLVVRMGYSSFEQVELPSILALLSLLLATLLLASALISLLVMRVITRPAAKMVLAAGGAKHDLADPFLFLQDYFNTLSAQQNQLSAENENLLLAKARFLSLMTNEIYFGMLTNPQFDTENEYVRSVIPELAEEKDCLLLLFVPRYASGSLPPPAQLSELEALSTHLVTVTVSQAHYIFLWCMREKADACEQNVREKFPLFGQYYTAMVRVRAPKEFHAAYTQLLHTLDCLRRDCLELPVSVENRVVNLVRANHGEKCRQLLETLREDYTPDAFIRLFARIGAELNCPMDSFLDRYADASGTMDTSAQWAVLDACVSALCTGSAAAQRKPADSPSAQSICWFIQEHYADPELSITLLAERFCLHRTVVSKLIKQHTGATFSDWLQSLRIDAAKQLLRESGLSAVAIAEQVGYANYTTFKRAFIRQCGCTPREYCQTAQNAHGE